MATLLGRGLIATLEGITCAVKDNTGASIAAYVLPNLQSLRVAHAADLKKNRGMNGKTTSLYLNDDILTMEADFICEGATIANAKSSATLPAAGATFDFASAPVISCGGVADAINAIWVYEGGGEIVGTMDGPWTGKLTLMHYPSVASPSSPVVT